jgi:hypothetical protein
MALIPYPGVTRLLPFPLVEVFLVVSIPVEMGESIYARRTQKSGLCDRNYGYTRDGTRQDSRYGWHPTTIQIQDKTNTV